MRERGITLVALVITIIIIIILATVAISFTFGNNGLIKRAEDATEYYANDTKYTEGSIANVEKYLDGIIGENGGDNPPEEPTMPDDWDESKVDAVESEDGVVVPVPKGFTASKAKGEKSVNTGFVIYQGTDEVNDSNVEEAQRSRNQFVWIPVDDESLAEMYNTTNPDSVADTTLSKSTLGEEATTTKLYSKIRIRSGDSLAAGIPGSTSYREPDILTDTTYGDASTRADRGINLIKSELGYSGSNAEVLKEFAQDMVNEYEAVFNSIKKYDGFYIGRYELTGTKSTPTVQREKNVLTAEATSANTWYGLKQACLDVVSTSEVQSTMIYGNQWDEVMNWLKNTKFKDDSSKVDSDSSSWGNHNNNTEEGAGSPQQSGYSDAWSANNIYDLAGNYWDWTQEASLTNTRVIRGR